jgi:hypothetical protein
MPISSPAHACLNRGADRLLNVGFPSAQGRAEQRGVAAHVHGRVLVGHAGGADPGRSVCAWLTEPHADFTTTRSSTIACWPTGAGDGWEVRGRCGRRSALPRSSAEAAGSSPAAAAPPDAEPTSPGGLLSHTQRAPRDHRRPAARVEHHQLDRATHRRRHRRVLRRSRRRPQRLAAEPNDRPSLTVLNVSSARRQPCRARASLLSAGTGRGSPPPAIGPPPWTTRRSAGLDPSFSTKPVVSGGRLDPRLTAPSGELRTSPLASISRLPSTQERERGQDRSSPGLSGPLPTSS